MVRVECRSVAKVVAAVVVSAVVIVGAAVVGAIAGTLLSAAGQSTANDSTFAYVDALGGALWGYDKIAKSNLWKWAFN